jgi:hypothetical protein
MAIYIDDIGQGELPLQINNPQEGESLIWSEELGAYVNAPGGGGPSTEQIQDTVADMLEVDPDGTQVALRQVAVLAIILLLKKLEQLEVLLQH